MISIPKKLVKSTTVIIIFVTGKLETFSTWLPVVDIDAGFSFLNVGVVETLIGINRRKTMEMFFCLLVPIFSLWSLHLGF